MKLHVHFTSAELMFITVCLHTVKVYSTYIQIPQALKSRLCAPVSPSACSYRLQSVFAYRCRSAETHCMLRKFSLRLNSDVAEIFAESPFYLTHYQVYTISSARFYRFINFPNSIRLYSKCVPCLQGLFRLSKGSRWKHMSKAFDEKEK